MAMYLLSMIIVSFWSLATGEYSYSHSQHFDKSASYIDNIAGRTNETLKELIYGSKNESDSLKQLPITSPCSCEDARCSCCAGIHIHGFGFDRQACAVMTYEPVESVLNMEFLLNNASLYKNRLSTRNQQFCIPIIPVTLVGPFDVCLRLYDMTVVEQRLHACLAMLGRVSKYPVLILQFNCMEMGAGGVGYTRPIGGNYNESALYPPQNGTVNSDIPQENSEIYDAVTERAPEKNLSLFQTL